MYVYLITNKVNNKQYVGITGRTVKERFTEHKESALYDKTKNTHLYKSMKFHGIANFTIETIDEALTVEELGNKERLWIKNLNTLHPNGYNYLEGGTFNYKLTEEHILTLSKPIKAISDLDGTEYYFISGYQVPKPFSNCSISNRVNKEISYRGYKWYFITKKEYLDSSKNSNIKEIPEIVAIKGEDVIFINKGKCLEFGFNSGKVNQILNGYYGRKTHKGYTFIRYSDYIMPQ